MSADRLLHMFLRRVKDENEGSLPEPLLLGIVFDGVAARAFFKQMHDGNDVTELTNEMTGLPILVRTSAISAVERLPYEPE